MSDTYHYDIELLNMSVRNDRKMIAIYVSRPGARTVKGNTLEGIVNGNSGKKQDYLKNGIYC